MRSKNFIPNLDNKTNYVVHYRDLQLYLYLGMKPTKIHKVLEFKPSDWMKKYIDFNTVKRVNAANDIEKYFFKINDQCCLWKSNGKFTKKNQCEISK